MAVIFLRLTHENTCYLIHQHSDPALEWQSWCLNTDYLFSKLNSFHGTIPFITLSELNLIIIIQDAPLYQRDTCSTMFITGLFIIAINWKQPMQTPTAKHWKELGDSYGRIGRRIADTNSIGRPTEWTNLDPWDSQRLNHYPKSIHGLDLGLSTHM